MKNNSFDEIAKVLENGEVCLIFPHIVMDGDGIGSAAALCIALRTQGKKAYVVKEDSLAENLRFLGDEYCINVEDVDFSHDISICVDCSEKKRFPKRGELFDKGSIKICIDHHKTAEYFCDYNYIDSEAAATAELIYELIKAMDVQIDEKIAKRIFAGITTDTGNFQYSNTTKKTHKIIGELYDICESFHDVSVALYENESFAKLKLQSEIIEEAQVFADGKAIISSVTQEMLKSCDAVMDDSEGSVSKLRSVENIEIAILMRENADGSIKASLRSKTYADVSEICKKYDGGGHARASGFTYYGSLDDIKAKIMEDVKAVI